MMIRFVLVGIIGSFAIVCASADRGEDLIAALSSDDPAVRRAAYTDIVKKEFESYHISAVAALLDSENPDVVRAASLALQGIVAPSTDATGLREIVGEALCGAIDTVENDHWLFWLLSYSGESNVCQRVGNMFGKEAFNDIVFTLEGIGGDAATRALIVQLSKSEDKERVALINAIGNLGGETATAALLNQATQPDPMGLAAIEALGRIGTPRAGIIIEQRLQRAFTMPVFMAYLKTTEALPLNERVLVYENILISSEDVRVRTAALRGLTETGGDSAIRSLLKALYSDDPAIHGAARNGLATINNDTTRVRIYGNSELRPW